MLTRARVAPRRRSKKSGGRAEALLAWYDQNQRRLPWRTPLGEQPDPYRVWLSEIMLQQTTVKAVAPYYSRFLARFPTVADLAAAPQQAVMLAWAGLGYYSRARHLHACARAVVEHFDGRFPDSEEALRSLPGIGPYTAAAIAAIAFDRKTAAVDGNVERVVSRLYAVEAPLPRSKTIIRQLAETLLPDARAGDFAQALMDLGATICTPRRPACILCPWSRHCGAHAAGLEESFPRREPKRTGALRRGAAFVALRDDGAVLLRTRTDHGLLGSMAEVPGTAWSPDFDVAASRAAAPVAGEWRRLPGIVRHVFTHFPLALTVYMAHVKGRPRAPAGCRWTPGARLSEEPLPSLMRKVLHHALRDGGRAR